MLKRIFLLCLLFTVLSFKIKADTFVVTNNSDSAPGSLRQALLAAAANGTATPDVIKFNLGTAETARTISILSTLNISSNLTIDGSSQPGTKFGVSGAKVILQMGGASGAFNAFTMSNVSDFALYGFYIRNFYGGLPGPDNTLFAAAFYIQASKNIQIGDSGKGNVFTDNNTIINVPTSTAGIENLKFYSNFAGIEPDGKSPRINPAHYGGNGINIAGCKGNIEIGAADVSKRNLFGNLLEDIFHRGNPQSTAFTATINIINNYFNFDINGNAVANIFQSTDIYFIHATNFNDTQSTKYPYTINITGNKIQYPLVSEFKQLTGDVTIRGNQELYGPQSSGNENRFIIQTEGNITLGGVAAGQSNTFYGVFFALDGQKNILVNHTAIFCTSAGLNNTWDTPERDKLPQIEITNITATKVSGTATPLSSVELYNDDDCLSCQPETYFASVLAGADGKWSYTGSITKGIIASATKGGFTSLFTSSPYSPTYQIINSGGGCGATGSAKFNYTNAGGFKITNANNETIATTAQAENLLPGNYKIAALNNSCSSDFNFTILDARPTIVTSAQNITNPYCGRSTGSITGLSITHISAIEILDRDYSVKWVDANGNVKSTSVDLVNVPPGSYSLQVSYKDQCPVVYGPITLSNTVAAPFNIISQGSPVPDHCGLNVGGVTAVQITGGVQPYTYKWINANGQQVGNQASLSNVVAGTYHLLVNDAGCSETNITYVVPDVPLLVSPPSVTNALFCTPGTVIIAVDDAVNDGVYRLYSNATDNQPIDEQTGGKFTITVAADRSYFISKLNGNCESIRVEMKVSLGSFAGGIANTFTPNNDGVNDKWVIKGIENYTESLIKVYSRDGALVYQSKGYSTPFDGTINGKELPAGAYYYIIDLKGCKPISGNVTIIR